MNGSFLTIIQGVTVGRDLNIRSRNPVRRHGNRGDSRPFVVEEANPGEVIFTLKHERRGLGYFRGGKGIRCAIGADRLVGTATIGRLPPDVLPTTEGVGSRFQNVPRPFGRQRHTVAGNDI